MNLQKEFEQYISHQKEIVAHILNFFGQEKTEEIDEDLLWGIDEELNSQWKLLAHGEHICCISDKGICIELPLYIKGLIGIDPGHFVDYLYSKNIKDYSYSTICDELEKSVYTDKISIHQMAPIWVIRND